MERFAATAVSCAANNELSQHRLVVPRQAELPTVPHMNWNGLEQFQMETLAPLSLRNSLHCAKVGLHLRLAGIVSRQPAARAASATRDPPGSIAGSEPR